MVFLLVLAISSIVAPVILGIWWWRLTSTASGKWRRAGMWPRYLRAEDATCFKCNGELVAIRQNNTAVTQDHAPWSGHCASCSRLTWFDVGP
jgi:hypothetical protein